jgi:hypothetical protein
MGTRQIGHLANLVQEAAKLVQGGSLQIEGNQLVESPNLKSLKRHVQSLSKSPLFNLSLASKELFHSNFLAWLCETYPNHVGPVFAQFTHMPSASCERVCVHREQDNIDLTMIFPNEQTLVVENKTKSIATREQLQGYSNARRNLDRTSFLLLSLIRPSFVPANEAKFTVGTTTWHFLSYADLICLLEPTVGGVAAIDRYHGEILADYLGFLRSLVAIAIQVAVDFESDTANFFLEAESESLRHIRLHDLMDKIRYGQVAERLTKLLSAEGCRVIENEHPWGAEPGDFSFWSAFYHGEALCQFSCLVRGGDDKIALGIMFQGHQINVFIWGGVETTRPIAEELMNPKDGGKIWFDLSEIPGSQPEWPKSGFKKFSSPKKDRILLYRSKKVDQCSPKELLRILLRYARTIRNDIVAIRSQIDAAGQPS